MVFPKRMVGGKPSPDFVKTADSTAVKNYGPIYSFKAYFRPTHIFAFSVAAYLAWVTIDILGTTETVFGQSFQDIEFNNTSIGSQGGELPNWLSAVTLLAQGGSLAYLFTRIFLRKMECETPFMTSFITFPMIFILNAIADGYWLRLTPVITIILSPIALFLAISIYWWRPLGHWIYKEEKHQLNNMDQRYAISHDSEPIEKLEFLCCDVPFKLLLIYQIRRMLYYVMTYGEILGTPNFNSAITVQNWYVTYVCVAVGIIIILHVGIKWDGAFGLLFGFVTVIDGFLLLHSTATHTAAILALALGFALVVVSFVACVLAYEHYDKTYYKYLSPKKSLDTEASDE